MILNDAGKIARDCWLAIPQHFPDVVLHPYIIMPNHIHGIIEITVGANKYSPTESSPKSPNAPGDASKTDPGIGGTGI
jgi:putative transposase